MDAAVLTLVITKLSDLLEHQVALIAGAEDEILSLRDDLRLLSIFLGGINDQSDGTTALVQELVDQLQRVSWKAEDVVDQYILDVARHERKKFVKKIFTGCGMLLRKGKLAAQAKDIKVAIDGILTNRERYGVRLDYGTSSDRPAQRNGENALDRRRRNVEEEDVVGFDQQTYEVMEMLMPKGGVEAEGLRVVSIIGMGGLGKTTLARKIFKTKEISNHFWTKVWVVVSEHVEGKHVLKNILQRLNVNIEEDDDDYLKKKIKERLDGSKYLIVLDDLWTPEQWQELKSYLPTDQKRGSRILLTSRIENVANVASTISTTYHLNPLGDADSWRLFCKKALEGKECPLHMEAVGKSIVSNCKGLPLAIIVLAGSLSAAEAEPSFGYWSKILSDTSWHPDADNDCSKILLLSYRNLPPHLKTCFLYVGVFPEDFKIVARELCLLWAAEGFVKMQQIGELEEAQQYLIDLADRNMIMISQRNSNGSIRFCRIHDLLRDLCVKEAERCNFYKVCAVGDYQNVKEGIRRLILHNRDLSPPFKGVRTLLNFANRDFSHLNSLRVLYICANDEYKTVRLRAKNLILLRYLKLEQIDSLNLNQLIMIPYLSNLQVLDLCSLGLVTLPNGIWKLKFLRHIYGRHHASMPDAQSADDSLPCLQTLSNILYEKHTLKMLHAVRFPNLRKLSVLALRTESLPSLPIQFLSKLLNLVALKISCMAGNPHDSISLYGDAFPSTLSKIHLNIIALRSDQWRLLGQLKNLRVLKLRSRGTHTSCEEERFLHQPLVFEEEAFPQLLHFKLRTPHPALILEDGALRALQCLIIRCWKWPLGLSALPDQLWLSTTLRQVKVIHPSDVLMKHIQGLDNSKRSKVTIRQNLLN